MLYHNLSVFSQLSSEARAIKGLRHGLIGGIVQTIEDKDADLIVEQTRKVYLFCIVLTHVVLSTSLCVLTAIFGGERDCY